MPTGICQTCWIGKRLGGGSDVDGVAAVVAVDGDRPGLVLPSPRPGRRGTGGPVTGGGVERVPLREGACWICGLAAVCGEKLPGRRHKVRGLCQTHADAVFGAPPEQPEPPGAGLSDEHS